MATDGALRLGESNFLPRMLLVTTLRFKFVPPLVAFDLDDLIAAFPPPAGGNTDVIWSVEAPA